MWPQVHTGDVFGAGTDANVRLTIFGLGEWSGELQLTDSDRDSLFEAGQIDVFEFELPSAIGEPVRIILGHDDSGVGAAWFVEQVHPPAANATELAEADVEESRRNMDESRVDVVESRVDLDAESGAAHRPAIRHV